MTTSEQPMVPAAEFRSYYGRPVVKDPVWKWDIPAYFVTGGVMAGSSLLAAGADLTGNRALRRAARLAAAAHLGASTYFLIHDLGRRGRFLNMLRVFKPTSPMSLGTWLLAAYGPAAGLAAASEVSGRVPAVGRAAGLTAGALAPAVASYTAVLIADTAVPAWHDAYRQLPFVFSGSAAAAAGGLAITLVRPDAAGPARRLAAIGAAVDLAATAWMERSGALSGEPYRSGRPGRLGRWARWLTAGGAAAGAVLGRRSRMAALASGAVLVAGSACTRFAVYEAGVHSARDPKYTIVPQRARVGGGGR
ncbi:MAG TPA: NrfD/PsrC family molybdoenzyme membrane anchor subunit [Acidimicrobiales bacterium]|nr:NrfD/PsrC family molybdoenzyme membrane anchor subunit [Acidimicrobiales bacterium]